MSDLARDTTGDLLISTAGEPTLLQDIDATVLRLRNKFMMFRGEWYADPRQGIPYREIVFNKTIAMAVKVALFRDAILADPGIESVHYVTLTPTTDEERTYTLDFAATHVSGKTFSSADFGPFIVGVV